MSALVGGELARSLGDKPCICVGTVMGPHDEIPRFCRTVLMVAAIPRSEIGGAFGADQAACNLAVHMGLVKAAVRPNHGRVATIGLTAGDQLAFQDGRVINPDGSASPIVHQHDRHPHLDKAIHALWGGAAAQPSRRKPRSASARFDKLNQSIRRLRRRLPELR